MLALSRRFTSFCKRSSISILILAPFLPSSAFPQTVVPITSEPDHHLVVSNNYVRVFQVELPPKTETLYHQHDYDYLYVAIGDADVTSTRLHEKPIEVKLKDGEVEFSKGTFAHKATNNSDLPFRNVTVELLRGAGQVFCTGNEAGCGLFTTHAAGNTAKGGSFVSQGQVFHAANCTAQEITLGGKGRLGPIRDSFLLVAISNLSLRRISQNSTHELSLKAGDPLWIDQPDTKVESSVGSAKFILISFSPSKAQ